MKDRKYIYVSFYANRRRLGGAYVPEGSTAEERMQVSKKAGIMNSNCILFLGREENGAFKIRKRKYGRQIVKISHELLI
jgi:hypothetical protein